MAPSGGIPEFHLPLPPEHEQGGSQDGASPPRSMRDVELGHQTPQNQGQPADTSTAGLARAGSAHPGTLCQIVTVDRTGSSNQDESTQQGMIRAGSAQAGTIQAAPTPKIVIGEGPSASGGFARYSSGASGEISPSNLSGRTSLDAQPGPSHSAPRRTGERRQQSKKQGGKHFLDKELIRIERRGQELAFKRAKGAEALEHRECRVCLSTDEQ
eukprot:1141584-Pelagomonas_calceolata.AAC.2